MSNTLKQIADSLVNHCRNGTEAEGLKTLYSPDAASVEAVANPMSGTAVTEGVDGIAGKHTWWNENFEVHSATVSGPFLHGDDRFGVIFEIDATEKSSGQRNPMKELGIYHVKDDKIVREEFFYST